LSSYTNEDLKIMQSWSLERKIQATQTRIIEWYQKWNGQVYVSFSGGKDSTVLLDLVRRIYPDVPAVFIDTGLEYPEVRDHVKSVDNVIWLRPQMNFKQVIKKYGYPLISKEVAQKIYEARKTPNGACAARFDDNSPHIKKYGKRYSMSKWIWLRDSDIPISHMCCTVMKKNPAKRFEKESGRKAIVGTMACESNMRKTVWLNRGCNAFNAKRPISSPLSFWTEQDILEYIRRFNITIPSIYGEIVEENNKLKTTGCDRTGCVFCGFGCHSEKEPNRFQRLKVTHPKLWNYCMKPWDEGGLGMKEVLEFIGVKTE
jgi:3'-phosphoadenosine 5'-phosphosulfate sulfotransferase (PAPS reductase)/FAD synthetase